MLQPDPPELEAVVAAIGALADQPATNGATTERIMERLGWGPARTRRYLRALARQGRLRAHDARCVGINGHPARTTTYEILDEARA